MPLRFNVSKPFKWKTVIEMFLKSILIVQGVFVAHGDIGSGTIIGSAVFNILVILSLVGVCARQVCCFHNSLIIVKHSKHCCGIRVAQNAICVWKSVWSRFDWFSGLRIFDKGVCFDCKFTKAIKINKKDFLFSKCF